jgi:DNA-nicking Smr family endonuclease
MKRQKMFFNTSEKISKGVKIIDLHGLDHLDAQNVVEKFITDNFDHLPIKIITGKSPTMQNIVFNCAKKHNLFYQKEFWTNDGCYLITDRAI